MTDDIYHYVDICLCLFMHRYRKSNQGSSISILYKIFILFSSISVLHYYLSTVSFFLVFISELLHFHFVLWQFWKAPITRNSLKTMWDICAFQNLPFSLNTILIACVFVCFFCFLLLKYYLLFKWILWLLIYFQNLFLIRCVTTTFCYRFLYCVLLKKGK